tara:strand:+ start:216 stop:674 length:459 start_codon:yes stop_codon:yes gene_type:complete
MQSTNTNFAKESEEIIKEINKLSPRKLTKATSDFIQNLLSVIDQNILKGLVQNDPDQYNQVVDYIDYYTRNGDEDAAVMVLKIFDEHKANGLRLQMANNVHKMFVEGSPTHRKLKREQEQTQEKKKDIDAPEALRVERLNDLNHLVNERIYQ